MKKTNHKKSSRNIFEIALGLIEATAECDRISVAIQKADRNAKAEYAALEKQRDNAADRHNQLEEEAMKCPVKSLIELVIKARIAESIGAAGFIGKKLEGTIEEWAAQSMARSIEQLADIPAPPKPCGYEGLLKGILDGSEREQTRRAIPEELDKTIDLVEDQLHQAKTGINLLHDAIAEGRGCNGIWWLIERVGADISAAHASATKAQTLTIKHNRYVPVPVSETKSPKSQLKQAA
jgi:hypothetical protein